MSALEAIAPLGRRRWRRRAPPSPAPAEPPQEDDCSSLAWLLSFRLDALVKAQPPEEAHAPPVILEEPESPPVRKPPYTYTELIEGALRDRGELTVSAIYQWISERFPFYKACDERWKNSVRHNLSINPHFRKGARAPHGAGHLWSLAASALDLLPPDRHPGPSVIVLDEAALAAASILPRENDTSEYLLGATTFLNPVSSEQVARECGLLSLDGACY